MRRDRKRERDESMNTISSQLQSNTVIDDTDISLSSFSSPLKISMGFTPYQFFLAGLMLVTGSINTLSTKWADRYACTSVVSLSFECH